MKKHMKTYRIFSLIMCLAVLGSLLTFGSLAETTDGILPVETDGTLLLEVDNLSAEANNESTGAEYRPGLASTSSFYSFSDGISTTTGTGTSGTKTYGGSTNISLTKETRYTVSYMVSALNASGGMRISYSANNSSIGVYMSSTQACLQWGSGAADTSYSTMKNFTDAMKHGDGGVFCNSGYAKVDIEIDGLKIYIYINDVLLLSEDISAPSNSNVAGGASKTYVSDTVSLVWHEFHSSDYTDTNTFKDIKIYSGLMHNLTVDAENGTKLLSIKDLSVSAMDEDTNASYTPSINTNDSFYGYNDENGVMNTYLLGSKTSYAYGGFTNLSLADNSSYTVSYKTKLASSGGSGMRISYGSTSSSVGIYMLGTNACIAYGTITGNGYSGYVNYTADMKMNNTVFCDDGYAAVDVEIYGTEIWLYVNGELLIYEDITNPSNSTLDNGVKKQYMSDTLSIVWQEYHNSTDGSDASPVDNNSFKDIEVYAGLKSRALVASNDGSLLLAVNDLSTGTERNGVTYTKGVQSHDAYSYNTDTGVSSTTKLATSSAAATYTYGGSTNLALSAKTKYTVTYMTKLSTNTSGGLRINFNASNNSIGVYMNQSQACVAWGTQTSGGYSGYVNYTADMKTGNTVFCNNGYAKVSVEIDGTNIEVYINDVYLLTTNVKQPTNSSANSGINKKFMSDTLDIVWHEFQTKSTGTGGTEYKNIRIYSGLLSDSKITLNAAQTRTADTSMEVRSVGVVKENVQLEGISLIGCDFEIRYKDADGNIYTSNVITRTTTSVYTSIIAGEDTYSKDDFGGYIFTAAISGLPTDTAVYKQLDVIVTAFWVDADGSKGYCEPAVFAFNGTSTAPNMIIVN